MKPLLGLTALKFLYVSGAPVDDKFVLSKETWSKVKVPNQGGFFDDDREKTEKTFWNPKPCMKDCRGPARITGHAQAIDVTPDEKTQKRGVE